jgi:hypothetical protein
MNSGFLRARMVLGALTLALSTSALTGCKSGGSGESAANTATSIPSVIAPTASNPSSGGNVAPKISGVAPKTAALNAQYSFAPSASDPDGDQLSFQIKNKPTWATFNTVTGQLSGKPSATGTFNNIVISASDGKASTALPAFTITVDQNGSVTTVATLNWVAPTENVDGSSLTDLSGFVISYGRSREALDQSVRITNPSIDSYTLDQLASGTYYFAIKAFNASGVESDLSEVVTKTIS